MKFVSISSIIILLLVGTLCLVQLWFGWFDPSIFLKVIVTFAIILAILVIVGLIRREYCEDKKMKKDGYLD